MRHPGPTRPASVRGRPERLPTTACVATARGTARGPVQFQRHSRAQSASPGRTPGDYPKARTMIGPTIQARRHLWEYHHHGAGACTNEFASFAELRFVGTAPRRHGGGPVTATEQHAPFTPPLSSRRLRARQGPVPLPTQWNGWATGRSGDRTRPYAVPEIGTNAQFLTGRTRQTSGDLPPDLGHLRLGS
jgi:hypothetical protein